MEKNMIMLHIKNYGLHMVLSAIMFKAFVITTKDVGISMILAFGIGTAKEVVDKYREGSCEDSFDMVANLIGISFSYILYIW